MEDEVISTSIPGPKPQSEASSPEGQPRVRDVVAALAETTEATSGCGSVPKRKTVIVAFCAAERPTSKVVRSKVIESRCILIGIGLAIDSGTLSSDEVLARSENGRQRTTSRQ